MIAARLVLGVGVLGSAALGAVPLAHPARTGDPGRAAGWERARVNAACEGCHVEIALEWRESRHRAAFTNTSFQRSLAREEPRVRPFCQGCHAPEASPLLPPSSLVADLGVGCVTCHAPAGPVLAAPSTAAGKAPHAVLRAAAFAGDEACAACHEFAFPGRSDALMQRTVTEHRATADGRTCTGCHMPETGGPRPHRSHRFPGGYDDALVRGALAIRTERTRPGRVRVTLRPVGATHAVPTGDLFRRLAIEALPPSGARAEEPAAAAYLARHFVRGRGMREIDDDRVHELARTVDLDVPEGAVRVRVRYERVGHHTSPDERDAEVESAVDLLDQLVP